jgi:hypothetical protein
MRAVRPLVISSLVVLTVYSLLPEQMRFSRALMLGGIALTLFAFVLNRIVVNLLSTGKTGLRPKALGQIAIVGLDDEIKRVKTILDQVSNHTGAWIRVAPGHDTPSGFPGNLTQLEDIIRVHKVDQVIFCARDVASSDIISAMSVMSQRDVEFKIAPPESLYIIGSNSIETSGDIFMLDVNSISRAQNKRSKRALDLALCMMVLIALPVLLIVASRRAGLFINWFRVLTGRKSWVGFCPQPEHSSGVSLPRIKPGVLHPLSHIPSDTRTQSQIQKLNSVYAKDYKLRNDLTIFWKNLSRLGH